MTARRLLLATAGSLLIVAAAIVVAWSAVTTSTARLSASTSGSGSFSAGNVELTQAGSSVALLFDADGLYPGRVIASCVAIDYEGSIPARIRLHASKAGGTGLEDYVELRLWVRPAGECPETEEVQSPDQVSDLAIGEPRFQGFLGELWRTHGDFEQGLELQASAESGDRLVIEAEVELVDDEAAQGLVTEFTMVLEARP